MLTLARLDFDISHGIVLQENFDYIRIRGWVKRSNRFLSPSPTRPSFRNVGNRRSAESAAAPQSRGLKGSRCYGPFRIEAMQGKEHSRL